MNTTTTQTKDIPLLFAPEKRSAVRAGIQTEARWVMDPQPVIEVSEGISECSIRWKDEKNSITAHSKLPDLERLWPLLLREYSLSPYGNPQLEPVRYWMREPTAALAPTFGCVSVHYPDDGLCDGFPKYHPVQVTPEDYSRLTGRKRPVATSRHMLKTFTRTWLRGKRVWPEPLGNITATGAISEGIELDPSVVVDPSDTWERQTWENSHVWRDYLNGGWDLDPVQSYVSLWQSIHGVGSWDPTQWVWVVQFELMTGGGPL
jgi:hypothetical protein